MKKKMIIFLSVLFCGIIAFFAFQTILREVNSRYAFNEKDKVVVFDTRVASVIARLDRQMAKEGYNIDKKTVGSGEIHGTEQLMTHNGVNMRLLDVKNSYSRLAEKVETESGYTEKQEDVVIECRFILVEDRIDRALGGGYYAYSGSMRRSDCTTYFYCDAAGNVVDTDKEKLQRTGQNFGGSLGSLITMAYNNYVAQVDLPSAFEGYE